MNIGNKKGFTLVELLIVIAIIAIIASVIFAALDPLRRFQDSRDSARWQDVSAISNAIQLDQVDNGGSYLSTIISAATNTVLMITDGLISSGCNAGACDTSVSDSDDCINLESLVDQGYLGDVPVSPNGAGAWAESLTGYTLEKQDTGVIVIRACESENSSEIEILR